MAHTSSDDLGKLASELASSKSELAADFSKLVSDAEDLLRTTAGYSGAGAAAARAKFQERLNELKGSISGQGSYMAERYREATQEANRYVHDNPWPAIGVAAAVGVLIGLLSGGRRGSR